MIAKSQTQCWSKSENIRVKKIAQLRFSTDNNPIREKEFHTRILLNKKYTTTQNTTGNPAYDTLMRFKTPLLPTGYSLCNYKRGTYQRLHPFSKFLLLNIGLPALDHSTICLFRAKLTLLEIMDRLLRDIRQAVQKGRD